MQRSRFDDPIGFQQVSHSTWNIWINLYRFTPVESNHIYHPKDGSSSSLSTGWMIDPESVEALVFKPDGQIGKWTFTYSSSELKITMFQKCIYIAISTLTSSNHFWNIVNFIHPDSRAQRFFHRDGFPRRCLPSSVRHWHEMARFLAACWPLAWLPMDYEKLCSSFVVLPFLLLCHNPPKSELFVCKILL